MAHFSPVRAALMAASTAGRDSICIDHGRVKGGIRCGDAAGIRDGTCHPRLRWALAEERAATPRTCALGRAAAARRQGRARARVV